MCFFFSLIPATICVVLGYFVLFSSTKTQGAVQMFAASWLSGCSFLPRFSRRWVLM
jgi:hypothetical protein